MESEYCLYVRQYIMEISNKYQSQIIITLNIQIKFMKKTSSFLMTFLVIFVIAVNAKSAPTGIKVGAARENIDVPANMYPMPTHFDPVQALYDSCYVRAIAMESGSEKVLMVIYELSDYPMVNNLQKQIADAVGFPVSNVVISVTHNHTSLCDSENPWRKSDPASKEKRNYFKTIELKAGLDASKRAVKSMRSAKVGFGTIDSYVNVNRDYKSSKGFWIEAPNYGGYSPKTLSILKFVDNEGKLICAILNYGCHNTSAFELPDFDGKVKTSGNMAGIACKICEKHYGNDAVVAWTAAASGDQNPIISHGIWYEDADGFITEKQMPAGVPYLFMENLGRTHGADAIRCIDSIEQFEEGSIQNATMSINLQAQKKLKFIEPRMAWKGDRDYTKVPENQVPGVPDFDQYYTADKEHPVEMDMHLMTIGNTAIMFTNGELYSRLGTEIKEESPFKNSFVVTYSLSPSTSYIIDKASIEHKVFQAYDKVKPGQSDDIILNAATTLYSRLKNN